MTTIRLCGGWHDGLVIPLPDGMTEPDLYVLPAPTPGLDEWLARDRREIARHIMTRVVVYRRRLPGIYTEGRHHRH